MQTERAPGERAPGVRGGSGSVSPVLVTAPRAARREMLASSAHARQVAGSATLLDSGGPSRRVHEAPAQPAGSSTPGDEQQLAAWWQSLAVVQGQLQEQRDHSQALEAELKAARQQCRHLETEQQQRALQYDRELRAVRAAADARSDAAGVAAGGTEVLALQRALPIASSTEGEVAALQRKLEDATATGEALRDQLALAEGQALSDQAALQQAEHELQQAQQRLQQALHEAGLARAELSPRPDNSDEVAALHAQVQQLRVQRDTSLQHQQELRQRIAQLESQLHTQAAVHDALLALQKDVAARDAQLADSERALVQQRRQHQSELAELHATATQESHQLQQQIHQLSVRLAATQVAEERTTTLSDVQTQLRQKSDQVASNEGGVG